MEVIRVTYTEGIWVPLLLTANLIGLYGIIITLLWRKKKEEEVVEEEEDQDQEED